MNFRTPAPAIVAGSPTTHRTGNRLRKLAGGLALLALAPLAAAAPLPPLDAAREGVTVSGLSSGAFMAVQFQIAHSRTVKGAGIVAGGPYDCAEGKIGRALANCMAPTKEAPPPTVARQRQAVDAAARAGRIDPPEHLRQHRVWLFSGGQDRTVHPPVVDALYAFYADLLPAGAIRHERLTEAGHAMISVDDRQANACATSDTPFINRCREFDAAGQLLAHLLGPLQPKARAADGDLLAFDQREFAGGRAIDASLADEAYAYVPKACRTGGCRIHVAFHGCRQSVQDIGRRFIEGAGYNAWADSNRLIVLYPQIAPRKGPALGSWKIVMNPKGCWDWWGYTGDDYATREAPQIKAVRGMIERLQGERGGKP